MILCLGEALIDMIPTSTMDGGMGFVPHSGGAILNTAIALGRLGVPAAMMTGLSTDMFGRQLAESLKSNNVDTSHIITSNRPTTLAFVTITDGDAAYSFFDENSAGRMLSIKNMPPISDKVSALYFGGISLACEPGADAYYRLLERESTERVVMLDPNIRPNFIENEARYRVRLESMISLVDIIKVSVDDLNWIRPGPQSHTEKVRELMKKSQAIVILTAGRDGAIGFLPDGTRVSTGAENIEVKDTVGAGDTFNAGILAKLHQLGQLHKSKILSLSGPLLQDAMAYGVKVASVTVSRAGANPPWSHEI